MSLGWPIEAPQLVEHGSGGPSWAWAREGVLQPPQQVTIARTRLLVPVQIEEREIRQSTRVEEEQE